MNKLLISCLLAASLGFAQNPWDLPGTPTEGVPAPEVAAPAPVFAPTPAPQAPAASSAPKEKSMFDVVRSRAYNPFAIAGAATNVSDLLITPNELRGQKFAYVSPTDGEGLAVFDMFGGSTALWLTTNPGLAGLALGYATSSFGVAIDYSVSKEWVKTETPDLVNNKTITQSQRTTAPGDNIGAYFSMPLGSMTIYANGSWFTYNNSYSYTIEGDAVPRNNGDIKADYSSIIASAGVLGSMGSLDYDLSLGAVREGGTLTCNIANAGCKDGDKLVEEDNSSLVTGVDFNIGYQALQNQTARVIVGFNNSFNIEFFDKIGSNIESDNIMKLVIAPNILGEVQLFDNWLAFCGASHDINFVLGDGDRDKKTSYAEIKHGDVTNAFAGVRYQRANWALEAEIRDEAFENPFRGFNGDEVFASVSGFINF